MNGPSIPGAEGLPDDIVPLRLPSPAGLFETRADRFRTLAPGHAIGGYLEWASHLAGAQARACRMMPGSPELAPPAGPTPLGPGRWPRSAAWRHALDAILRDMRSAAAPPETSGALARLASMPDGARESLASAVLETSEGGADLAASVFVAAALQVYWTALAATIPRDLVAMDGPTAGCPLCGSPPVAGIVLGDRKLRYLVCGLCGAKWHLTRAVCAQCRATGALSYLSIEGRAAGVRAEACGACRTYLKLFYLEETPFAEAFADDVATLAVDLMVSEEGYSRAGSNCFLLAG